MTTNPLILDMLGDGLRDAVVQAQTRLGDDTVMARCENGVWLVERGGAELVTGLTYADAITHVAGLS